MIEVAREVIIETNSLRFLRKSLAFICKLNRNDTVITDSGILDDDKKDLKMPGLKLLTLNLNIFLDELPRSSVFEVVH
jgi:DeoR family transcriptional regulator, aga operon transcriptional repressor